MAGGHGDSAAVVQGGDSLGGGNLGVQLVFDPADELKLGILILSRAANHLRPEPEFGGKDAGCQLFLFGSGVLDFQTEFGN